MAKQNTVEDGWRRFIDLCLNVKTPKQMDALFKLFMTAEERRDFSKRALLINALLDEKLTQREIAQKFKISIARITRGSNALKIISEELQGYLKDSH